MPAYHAGVGFNPFRRQDRTATDVFVVALFVVITLALVAWAIFSG